MNEQEYFIRTGAGLKRIILHTRTYLFQSSDSEAEDADPSSAGPSTSTGKKKREPALLTDFGRNVNVEKVLSEQRDLRDKAKAEHATKKERDKEDR